MKQSIESIARAIVAHADANDNVSWAYAIRTDYVAKKVGSLCRRSCDWNHEMDRPSSRKLSGTCGTLIAVEIDSWTEYEDVVNAIGAAMDAHANNRYPGERIYIIAGNADYAVGGDDLGEVVLSADTSRTNRGEGTKGAEIVYIIK